MYSKEFYKQLTSDVARKVASQLFEDLKPVIEKWPYLPLSMKLSQASQFSGLSVTALRNLYHEQVISGKHTGTSDNSPILLHTRSLLAYLGQSDSVDKESLKKVIGGIIKS